MRYTGFGPAIIGKEQYEKERAIHEKETSAAGRFGPLVTDAGPAPSAPPTETSGPGLPPGYEITGGRGGWFGLEGPSGPVPNPKVKSGNYHGEEEAAQAAAAHYEASIKEAAEPVPTYSVAELEKILAKDSAQVDPIMKAEFARPDGPRIGAIEALRAAEESKPAPRAEVLAALDSVA